jgi:hypothetical protein
MGFVRVNRLSKGLNCTVASERVSKVVLARTENIEYEVKETDPLNDLFPPNLGRQRGIFQSIVALLELRI